MGEIQPSRQRLIEIGVISLSRSSRSTSASRRLSSIRTSYTSLYMQALYTPDGFAMTRSW